MRIHVHGTFLNSSNLLTLKIEQFTMKNLITKKKEIKNRPCFFIRFVDYTGSTSRIYTFVKCTPSSLNIVPQNFHEISPHRLRFQNGLTPHQN